MKMPRAFWSVFSLCVRIFGSTLIDQRTGKAVAKAIMFCWRGKVYLLGLEGQDQVIPLFLPQKRISFWKREIGFQTHPPPDFARESATGKLP